MSSSEFFPKHLSPTGRSKPDPNPAMPEVAEKKWSGLLVMDDFSDIEGRALSHITEAQQTTVEILKEARALGTKHSYFFNHRSVGKSILAMSVMKHKMTEMMARDVEIMVLESKDMVHISDGDVHLFMPPSFYSELKKADEFLSMREQVDEMIRGTSETQSEFYASVLEGAEAISADERRYLILPLKKGKGDRKKSKRDRYGNKFGTVG